MSVIKIKLCPFCGGEPHILSNDKTSCVRMWCFNCGVSTGWFLDKKSLLKVWNRRYGNGDD